MCKPNELLSVERVQAECHSQRMMINRKIEGLKAKKGSEICACGAPSALVGQGCPASLFAENLQDIHDRDALGNSYAATLQSARAEQSGPGRAPKGEPVKVFRRPS